MAELVHCDGAALETVALAQSCIARKLLRLSGCVIARIERASNGRKKQRPRQGDRIRMLRRRYRKCAQLFGLLVGHNGHALCGHD